MTQTTRTEQQKRQAGVTELRAIADAFRGEHETPTHYDDGDFYARITAAYADYFCAQPDGDEILDALCITWASSRCANAKFVALALDLLADRIAGPAIMERRAPEGVTNTAIYARDLRPEICNNNFMGAGFENVLREAGDDDEVIVGYFVKKPRIY